MNYFHHIKTLIRPLSLAFVVIGLVFLSSCIKEDYFTLGNQINLISPYKNFKEDNPDKMAFRVFNGQGQAECEFIVVDKDGIEHNLAYFNSGNGFFDQMVMTPIDWADFRDNINPSGKLTFRTKINFLTEEAFTIKYNETTGEYEKFLVSDYINYWKTSSIDMEARLDPNRIYELDILAGTLEDQGIYIQEKTNTGNGTAVSGNWLRRDGASYLKFTGSSVYLCNPSMGKEFSGTYNAAANEATLTEDGVSLTFKMFLENNTTLRVEQYVSDNHVGSTYYYSTNDYGC